MVLSCEGLQVLGYQLRVLNFVKEAGRSTLEGADAWVVIRVYIVILEHFVQL